MSLETKIIGGISAITIAIVVLAIVFLGGSATPSSQQAPKIDQSLVARNTTHIIKGKDAKVTIVEFADYQCPACGGAYPITKQILSDYEGKVNFYFRNFPLPMHPNAQIAAEAAEAAGAQGKYFEMHDKLYENQNDWADSKTPLDLFTEYAKEIKLGDINKFQEDVKNEKYKKNIETDMHDGNAVGVNATPTFYINGFQYSTVLSYDQFKEILDTQLKAK